ncbi:sensor histidine kinase [Viridibacillus sp. NPDC096237]|uniref:sensor histidine kinase n=1 Tax=Viridibacillus sp. NPDC096237 TaxID=3390721 RepID=UPI003D0121DC
MKLKTWLLLSYFIVMILPLAAAYALFAWVNAYHEDRNVEEYFEKWTELQKISAVLKEPNLYEPGIKRPQVEELSNAETAIVLYRNDGLPLYNSDPLVNSVSLLQSKDTLYKNLFQFENNYRNYSYKEPVFSRNELVGFFEVNLARDEWIDGVNNRTWSVIALFIGIFSIIFISVSMLVNRKLNKRLSQLMKQMMAFASREKVEDLQTANDEIGELTASFYSMREQIEEAREKIAKEQKEKEFMIAAISHDLKTPLTSIRAYAESLSTERNLPEGEYEEYRGIIINKANYMQHMLDDLLMYTLLQSSTYEMELVQVEGCEFFDMLLSDYEPLCYEKNITLEVQSEIEGIFNVNPKQLMRVTDNLMSNAIQHTPKEGFIWLAVVSSDNLPKWVFPFVTQEMQLDGPLLIVQNGGEGIDKEELEHVFEPLFQADIARSKKGESGTGLGLSITKQIIEKHGGKVQMLSHKTMGTCVICKLSKIEGIGDGNENNIQND